MTKSDCALVSIAINPLNESVIYAGTGDRNIGGYFSTGTGAYKSNDFGATWQYIGLSDQKIISDIVIDPTDTNILYAATMGSPSLPNADRGLYKSINGGNSWSQILFIGDSAGINDIAINPNNPNEIYASGWTRYRTNQASIVSGNGGKVWKTIDGGNNWTELNNGLPTGQQGRVGLALFESNPDTLYSLFVGTNSQLQGIYRTMDGGSKWTEVPTTSTGVSNNALGGFGWYFGDIYVNPYDYEDIFFNGIQLWRTENSGTFWLEADPPWWTYEVHADKHDMIFLGPEEFLLATDGGLYHTDDNGDSWDKIENNKTNDVYRVEHSEHFPDNYYCGMQDNGTSGGNYNQSTWPRIYGGDGFQLRYHPTNEYLFYVETQNGNIAYSDDGGSSFNNTSFPDMGNRTNWDTPYILSSSNQNLLYAASHKVWKDTYAPYGNWTQISPDLTDGNIYGSQFHTISGLDESSIDPDRLYACTSDGNVWRTTNAGTSWDSIHTGLPNRYVTSIKASPTDEDHLFVTHSGYKYNDFFPHIHKSVNNGNSWTDISGDLPPIAINDVIIYPGHEDSVLFIGTDAGVYGTIDGGIDWERVGTNMPNIAVLDLEIDTINNRLVAATYGKSIMTYPLDSLIQPVADSSLSVSLIMTPKTCSLTNNGSIQAIPIGGTGPYTYSWNNGQTTSLISSLAGGNYTVTLTDQNGDISINSVQVTHNPIHPQPLVGPLIGSQSAQSWTTYDYSVDQTSGSIFNWSISGGTLNSINNNAANVSWNAGPQGTLTISEQDINGCTSSESFIIDILFVGIDETPESSALVYPNPSNGIINLEFSNPISSKIEVWNTLGQLVAQDEVTNASYHQLNLNLPSETYTIRYRINDEWQDHKVVIKR